MGLAELKDKWFIEPSSPVSSYPPVARHPGTEVTDSTDGNTVSFLADGQAYMAAWHDAVLAAATLKQGEVYHSGWRFENVYTLGQSKADSGALDIYAAAKGAGVSVYVLLSMHGFGVASILNANSLNTLYSKGLTTVCLDARSPFKGSTHQKAVVVKTPASSLALVGSVDISKTRWDTSAHKKVDAERDPSQGKPTHDSGVLVKGPAVADIERSFRERWNDGSRTLGMTPLDVRQPLITTPVATPAPTGTHSVQVLFTYGRTSAPNGYNWHGGEFTLWAAYLKAIRQATSYIYVEDQYFLPFGKPPFCLSMTSGDALNACPVYQIGQRLKAGVRVAIMLPSNAEDPMHDALKFHRDLGLQFLFECDNGRGNLAVISLEVERVPVYVHSKLLLVDDEYVLIGSANSCQRSMTCDTELSVGIVDAAGQFAADVRRTLWSEHLQLSPGDVADVAASFDKLRRSVGRVRPYPYGTPNSAKPPLAYDWAIDGVIDPYRGPDR
jgi:phosphatidylserine/phosphatidylglycerophosphate/cardiolipin synthase-like enzyme